jgi:hypothetical protein
MGGQYLRSGKGRMNAGARGKQVDGRAAKLAKTVQRLKGQHSGINLVGALQAVEVTAVISPLSTPAQRIAPLLQFVHTTLNVSMKVALPPRAPALRIAVPCALDLLPGVGLGVIV